MDKLRGEFGVAKGQIQSGHNRAEKADGEETFDVFDRVWLLNRHDVPGTHANPMQARCNFRNPLFQFTVRDGAVSMNHCLCIRLPPSIALKPAPQSVVTPK